MVNKKVVIFVTIITLVIVGIIFYMSVSKLYNEETYVGSSIENSEGNNQITNTSSNSKTENTIENNNTTDNTIDNTTNTNISTEEDNKAINSVSEKTNPSNSEKKDSEEVAKDLVREKEKNPSNVYYTIEKKVSEGVFIVSVRDNETTEEIDSYKVNTNTGEVTNN